MAVKKNSETMATDPLRVITVLVSVADMIERCNRIDNTRILCTIEYEII
jgi:hypothetical protein